MKYVFTLFLFFFFGCGRGPEPQARDPVKPTEESATALISPVKPVDNSPLLECGLTENQWSNYCKQALNAINDDSIWKEYGKDSITRPTEYVKRGSGASFSGATDGYQGKEPTEVTVHVPVMETTLGGKGKNGMPYVTVEFSHESGKIVSIAEAEIIFD